MIDAALIDDWVRLQTLRHGTPEHDKLFPAFEAVAELTHRRPEEGWAFILAVLERDSSASTLENLSAGPLEDLLVYHGGAFIDRIEKQASSDPLFATLLGGVWRNAMDEDVWNRVCVVRKRCGWDGIPAV